MDNEAQILALLQENKALAEKAYVAAEKTRKYLLWTGLLTVVAFVLPLLFLALYLPTLLAGYAETMSLDGLM